MALTKGQQNKLKRAFNGDRDALKHLLDEIQEMRNKYNELLAKLDTDSGVTDTDYDADLEIEDIRE